MWWLVRETGYSGRVGEKEHSDWFPERSEFRYTDRSQTVLTVKIIFLISIPNPLSKL